MLLAALMAVSLLAGCSKGKSDVAGPTAPAASGAPADAPAEPAEASTYTYHGTYSGVSTWSPTDWEISMEYDMLGYTVSPFYGFWMNETKDGYDIVPELAAEFPVDVTAEYAGNEVLRRACGRD